MPLDPFGDSSAETPEEETARLTRDGVWQAVMRTDEGRKVLSSILRDLGLFSPVVGERMAGRHEAAIMLAREMMSINDTLTELILTETMRDDEAF